MSECTHANTELITALKKTEKNRSLFEVEIRRLPLPTIATFLANGKIVAAGGHNVLVGLKRALGSDNALLGVLNGPKGLLEGRLFEITDRWPCRSRA
ncbi:MAG: hypothetical protein WC378_00395 [Opitutaceae bacterium]